MPYPPENPVVESHAWFSSVKGKAYLEVRELVRAVLLAEWAPRRRHSYEGVMIARPPLYYILLRSNLDRRPKIYTLAERSVSAAPSNRAVLEGDGFEAIPHASAPSQKPIGRHFRVQFVPVEETNE